jgi:hypothetical protein
MSMPRRQCLCLVVLLSAGAVCARPSKSSAQQSIPEFARCDVPIGVAPSAITADDFNGDGNPDLAAVGNTSSQVVVRLTNRNLLRDGDCIGGLSSVGDPPVVTGLPVGIAAGNVDPTTAFVDLVVAVPAGVSILTGDGTGTFVVGAPIAAGTDPQVVAIADVDGDGMMDIVVGNGAGNSISILYGKAGGGFELLTSEPVNGSVSALVVRDLNKDSFVDVAATTNLGEVSVFLQDRNMPREFQSLPPFVAGVNPTAMAAGDFNRDGTPDLAVTSGGTSGELAIFISQLPDDEVNPFVQSSLIASGSNPSALGIKGTAPWGSSAATGAVAFSRFQTAAGDIQARVAWETDRVALCLPTSMPTGRAM